MSVLTRPIHVRELVVVNFKTKFFDDDIRAWKNNTTDIAVAESCNRQVWFGLQDDFADFPGRGRANINYFEDRDAYDFLVRLYLGLESARLCEDSIKGQLCDGWEQFAPANPRTKKVVDSIMQDMKADSRFVSGAILSTYKHHKHEIAARDLSGQAKGDKALLIGSLNRNGNLSSFTDGLARVIGNKRAGRVDEIVVTHPDADTLRALYDHMRSLKNRGILAAEITRAPFRDICQSIEESDRVYVDIPMGSRPEDEEMIVLAWATRHYQDNTLTHLRGNPNNMGLSTPLWEETQLTNYISPEAIRDDMAERGRHNAEVIRQAIGAIKFCSKLRMEGDTPSNAKVRDYVQGQKQDQSSAPALLPA